MKKKRSSQAPLLMIVLSVHIFFLSIFMVVLNLLVKNQPFEMPDLHSDDIDA